MRIRLEVSQYFFFGDLLPFHEYAINGKSSKNIFGKVSGWVGRPDLQKKLCPCEEGIGPSYGQGPRSGFPQHSIL